MESLRRLKGVLKLLAGDGIEAGGLASASTSTLSRTLHGEGKFVLRLGVVGAEMAGRAGCGGGGREAEASATVMGITLTEAGVYRIEAELAPRQIPEEVKAARRLVGEEVWT